MTSTDALIARLADDTRVVPRHAVARRLVVALAIGAAGAMLALTLTLGRPFLGTAEIGVADYGVKLAFTAALVLITARLLIPAGRPESRRTGAIGWIAAPVLLLAGLAAWGFGRTPVEARAAYVMGDTWATCLPSVIALSLPVFAAIVVAFRRLAPTDLPRAGTLAGLTAGATSAAVYALHCPETSPAFVLIWYGLGIATAGLIGRLLGPTLLRW